jgi:hypothetical protein
MSDGLFDKSVKCPVCGHAFKTKKVKTASVKVEKRDTDFCAYYGGENPTFYGVYVCPKCGYASFESLYNDISNAQIEFVRKKIMANWSGKDYCGSRTVQDAIEVHKLALLNFNVMSASRFSVAKACLRLAWFYRLLEDEDNEMAFIKHAATHYEYAFSNEEFENAGDKEYVIYYLLGELNRKLGEYRKATTFYDMAIRHPEIETQKQIKQMAQEQRMAASEEYRKMKQQEKGDD